MAAGDTVTVKILIDQAAVNNFLYSPSSSIGTFRRVLGVSTRAKAIELARDRLSVVSGGRNGSWHRPYDQPGRTGEYDTKFTYRTYVANGNIVVSLRNSASYAEIVERGTSRTNYIIRPRAAKRLAWYSYTRNKFMKSGAVIHPGPWRAGTANSRGRSGGVGEMPGFGSYIMNDAIKIATREVLAAYRFLG